MFIHSKWSCGCSPCCTHVIEFGFCCCCCYFSSLVWFFIWIRGSNRQLTLETFVLCLSGIFLHLSFTHQVYAQITLWVLKFSFVSGIELHSVSVHMLPQHSDSPLITNLPSQTRGNDAHWRNIDEKKSNLWPSLKYSR